jgi:hypothetical protein
VGLAAKPGLGRIYGFGGIASFIPGWAQAREAHASLVPLSTLDTFVADRFHGKKLLIKIDVEGFELEVLAGARKTLSLDPKPTWLVEILLRNPIIPSGTSRSFFETFEVFWGKGYRCAKLDPPRTPITDADVSRWITKGAVDADMHDFLFWAD